MRVETTSARETEAVAARLACGLTRGDVVLVSGDLGAGKTTFVRGAARSLGVEQPVTSPTFTIGQIYEGRDCEIAHVDLYRLDSADDSILADYLTRERIAFVEWPRVAAGQIDSVASRVEIEHAGADRRVITIR